MENIKFINLTPHNITLVPCDGGAKEIIEKSGMIARVSTESEIVGSYRFNNKLFPIKKTRFDKVTDLPEPQNNVVYIVSALVRSAVPERHDVVSPTDLERDQNGQPTLAKAVDGNF